ncbi:MAG: aminodeoxychorismate/anthranilate synthase component II [Bdellovibrionales bacterium]|nr:aminodeoxychorismate/anthranilate synthase component II [Bdellovibrionales bacterium]
MILVIDNYDSFTFNLVQYLGELLGCEEHYADQLLVVRNDQMSVADIEELGPQAIVISPGPCTPNEAGVSLEVIRKFYRTTPILGICLGHQAIGQAFGGRVVRAATVSHGKTDTIIHDETGIFHGIPPRFTATRYHSLIVDRDSLPDTLRITAWLADGTIMGVEHRSYPHTIGLQFHPESIMTEPGKALLQNFLSIARQRNAAAA